MSAAPNHIKKIVKDSLFRICVGDKVCYLFVHLFVCFLLDKVRYFVNVPKNSTYCSFIFHSQFACGQVKCLVKNIYHKTASHCDIGPPLATCKVVYVYVEVPAHRIFYTNIPFVNHLAFIFDTNVVIISLMTKHICKYITSAYAPISSL